MYQNWQTRNAVRATEIVLRRITHDETVAIELLAEDGARAHEALVIGVQDAEFRQQQYAGVQIIVIEGAGDHATPLVPRACENLVAQCIGLLPPMRRPAGKAKALGDVAAIDATQHIVAEWV